MTYIKTTDYQLEVAKGNVSGTTIVRKFGRNPSIGTTTAPISITGLYQTPTAATALEIVSSSANDTSAGSGARTVTIIGLNSSFVETTQTVTMNGTTPVALSTDLIRAYRMYVETSGTYGSASAGSHAGTITLRTSGGGATWLQLALINSFPMGQSLCGAYTVPDGYTGYVYLTNMSVESTKTITLYFFQRPNSDTVSAPYSSVRVQSVFDAVAGFVDFGDDHFLGAFSAKTDVGFMANTSSGTAAVSVEFKIYLVAV